MNFKNDYKKYKGHQNGHIQEQNIIKHNVFLKIYQEIIVSKCETYEVKIWYKPHKKSGAGYMVGWIV